MILHSPAYEDGTDRVPKRRQLELRRRGITQKGIIYNTVHVCTTMQHLYRTPPDDEQLFIRNMSRILSNFYLFTQLMH